MRFPGFSTGYNQGWFSFFKPTDVKPVRGEEIHSFMLSGGGGVVTVFAKVAQANAFLVPRETGGGERRLEVGKSFNTGGGCCFQIKPQRPATFYLF